MSYDELHAASYEHDAEHMLPPGEVRAWLGEMRSVSGHGRVTGRVLDIGAGTGLLTAALKEAGLRVTGLEPSRPMISQGLRGSSELRRSDFVVGEADDARLFGVGQFDWIVCRQVLCHLTRPARCFATWHGWLKVGGHALLVDGFWQRASWSGLQLESQPFAALESAQPVAEMLAEAGFEVLLAGPFTALNEARTASWPNTRPRYLVSARKT